jgi:hypothetical protein
MQTLQSQPTGKYADVNGIRMYYEIHGTGSPLVLLHALFPNTDNKLPEFFVDLVNKFLAE